MSNIKVDITFDQLLEVAKQLSPSEKSILEATLWSGDEISQEDQELVLSRIAKARENPTMMLDWDEASKAY